MKFAYIFDFDGVLVRTMEAHFRCYQRALEEVGVPIDRGQFYRQAGMTGQEQIRYFAQRAQVSVDVEAVYRRKRAIWEAGDQVVTVIDCNVALLRAPSPALFLCAAERLGTPPADCIVVEDSDVGVEAARAAKMRVMRFYDQPGD